MITARSGSTRARVLEHLHAADAVHAEVGDDDVEAAGLDAADRLLAAVRRLDLVAFLRTAAPSSARRMAFSSSTTRTRPGMDLTDER